MKYEVSSMKYMKKAKIINFTDLQAWKDAHKLVLVIYQTTKKFPKEEKFSLIDQMRRCSISISSNIAEGFSRQGSKEKLQFYFMSKGSLTELQNQIHIAKDLSYITLEEYKEIYEQTILVSRLLTGLIKYLRK